MRFIASGLGRCVGKTWFYLKSHLQAADAGARHNHSEGVRGRPEAAPLLPLCRATSTVLPISLKPHHRVWAPLLLEPPRPTERRNQARVFCPCWCVGVILCHPSSEPRPHSLTTSGHTRYSSTGNPRSSLRSRASAWPVLRRRRGCPPVR